jgi:hypothetical protein
MLRCDLRIMAVGLSGTSFKISNAEEPSETQQRAQQEYIGQPLCGSHKAGLYLPGA